MAVCPAHIARCCARCGGTSLHPSWPRAPSHPPGVTCWVDVFSRVLDQRYPVLIATTGSCVRPRFSVSLCHRLWSTILAGCCEPLLHLGLSRRYLCKSFLGCLNPYHGGWQSALTRFFPCHIGLPQKSTGSAVPRYSAQRLQSGEVLRGCSHLIIFRPPSLLPPRSFPPLSIW